ncbi:interleukin-17 receptor A-like isoform X1 [Oncorhynchus mykiss]|uniref:SEFIR domain-containing protein n=1 Tax=Oncorhynchus mykiss TaxID=8022 RepID=A0A8K9XPN5_ONCMY|nr:interleukin-17 receptor A-like isoform X1 [Oncorhynchus mykiss]
MKLLLTVGLLLPFVSTSSSLRILEWPTLNCTQEGLRCEANVNNCLDPGWLKPWRYTPSSPVNLEVELDTRKDEEGHLVPVLVARWKAQDDGSISSLKGTELHVLKEATNQNLCVRYEFFDKMSMRNPAYEKWSFSLDRVVVEPGLSYVVSVSNLPKPNLKHSGYNIDKHITVPDCKDPKIQKSKVCLESGSLWRPNTTLERSTGPQGRTTLTVGFSTDQHSHNYRVSLLCSSNRQWQDTDMTNQTWLTVVFDLEKWPQTCCYFDVEIHPFFSRCNNDCVRRRKTFNICETSPTVLTGDSSSPKVYTAIAAAVVLLVGGMVCCLVCQLRTRRKKVPPGPYPPAVEPEVQIPHLPRVPPKVLVIYSQDHPLYRKIVLKLCAFLQAKCGTEVVLDLLDTTWLGTVGRLPWLEWQRQQVNKSSDKILVLCSRGVQAKWRAMCGQSRVTLREDLRSPIDDMLTPALNLFLPDMQQAAALGKYMVAYFDEVGSERDVPSVFDIAVKYKLMKHFEELCFRILDQEKYAPGQVSHIEGIGVEEYFTCPPGRDLRDAIEAFQAFQLENPDWFEQECVDINAEEEVFAVTEYDALLEKPVAPVLEFVPEYRNGPPVLEFVPEYRKGPPVLEFVPEFRNGPPVLEFVPEYRNGPPVLEFVPEYRKGPPVLEFVPEYRKEPPVLEFVPEYRKGPPVLECVPENRKEPPVLECVPENRKGPPVLECVPEYRKGPPISNYDVEINENSQGVQVSTPEVKLEGHGTCVLELLPRVNSDSHQMYPSYPVVEAPPGVLISDLHPNALESQPCGLSDLLPSEPPLARENCLRLQERWGTADRCPLENEEEEEAYSPSCQPSVDTLEQLMSLQLSLCGLSAIPEITSVSTENGYLSQPRGEMDLSLPVTMGQSRLSFSSIQVTPPVPMDSQIQYLLPLPEITHSQPVEMEEGGEVMKPAAQEKRPVSGSDLGYISRSSFQQDSSVHYPVGEDSDSPLVALARLQQALYLNN